MLACLAPWRVLNEMSGNRVMGRCRANALRFSALRPEDVHSPRGVDLTLQGVHGFLIITHNDKLLVSIIVSHRVQCVGLNC